MLQSSFVIIPGHGKNNECSEITLFRIPLLCTSSCLVLYFLFCLSVFFLSDEEELRKSFSELGEQRGETNSRGMKRTGSGLVSPSGALLYKTGFLVRKVHADCDGKRSE